MTLFGVDVEARIAGLEAHLAALLRARADTWRADAACAGLDPVVFFPAMPRGTTQAATFDEARRIWATCPVDVDCLRDLGEREGMWGGTTPNERHTLRGLDRAS